MEKKSITPRVFEIYTLDIEGCSQEDKEELKDYPFCYVNFNDCWYSYCFGRFVPTKNPFENKYLAPGAKVVKATGEFYKVSKESFEFDLNL